MSSALCVLAATDPAGTDERPAAGPQAGFDPLEQTLLSLGPGAARPRATGAAEEVLFVLDGAGELVLGSTRHRLEAETGANIAPDQEYALQAAEAGMRLVSVRVPDPADTSGEPVSVRRLADQTAQEATTDREFRLVAEPPSATAFVGYIPTVRAPEHFHTYDEVIYVLEGEGLFHAEGDAHPVGPGTCIGLPARLVHCLENTGQGVMRVLGVFRPAGSPAAAYYPDGTPAYPGAMSYEAP
jgi:quercetin dioxygenase-like cupin family protein